MSYGCWLDSIKTQRVQLKFIAVIIGGNHRVRLQSVANGVHYADIARNIALNQTTETQQPP
jgi:hypothetical protein